MFKVSVNLNTTSEIALDSDAIDALIAALRTTLEAADLTPVERNFVRINQSSSESR